MLFIRHSIRDVTLVINDGRYAEHLGIVFRNVFGQQALDGAAGPGSYFYLVRVEKPVVYICIDINDAFLAGKAVYFQVLAKWKQQSGLAQYTAVSRKAGDMILNFIARRRQW